MTIALLSTTYFGPVQWYQKLYRYDRVLIERHETFQKQTYRNRCLIATTQGVQALTVPVKAPTSLTPSDCRGSSEAQHASHSRGRSEAAISNHGNWRHVHWQALQSAYGDSPFFEYYEDDLRPFFFEDRWLSLYDFNRDICTKICNLIDIKPHISYTTEFIKSTGSIISHSTERTESTGSIISHAAGQTESTGSIISRSAGQTESTGSIISHSAGQTESADSTDAKVLTGRNENTEIIVHDFRNAIQPKHPLPDADFLPRPYYQVYQQKHGFLPNLSILDLLFNMGPESIFYL